ncbi:retron Ec48 family effector membrane protein [Aeromonas salmonicida]
MKNNHKHTLLVLSVATTLLTAFIFFAAIFSSFYFVATYRQLTEGEFYLVFCNSAPCYEYFMDSYQKPIKVFGVILTAFPALAFTVAAKTYILNAQNAAIGNKTNVSKDFTLYLDELSLKNFTVKDCVNKRKLFNSTFEFESHIKSKAHPKFSNAVRKINQCITKASQGYATNGNRFDRDAHIASIKAALFPVGIEINVNVPKKSWDEYEKEILFFLDSIIIDWFYEESNLSDLPRDYIPSFKK